MWWSIYRRISGGLFPVCHQSLDRTHFAICECWKWSSRRLDRFFRVSYAGDWCNVNDQRALDVLSTRSSCYGGRRADGIFGRNSSAWAERNRGWRAEKGPERKGPENGSLHAVLHRLTRNRSSGYPLS